MNRLMQELLTIQTLAIEKVHRETPQVRWPTSEAYQETEVLFGIFILVWWSNKGA
jgi:hypothetical protein